MLPPGPDSPAVVQTFRYMMWPEETVAEWRTRYGETFSFHTLNARGVMVTSASGAKDVFAKDPDGYDAFAASLEDVLGKKSLFATSGATHRAQRKLLNGRFHGEQLRRFLDTMHAIVSRHVDALRDRDVHVMLDLGQEIALEVILETVFGDGDVDLAWAHERLIAMIDRFSPAIIFSKHLHTPLFPPWREFARSHALFTELVAKTAAIRRGREHPGRDIFGMFLDARYDDGAPMDDDEIVAHLLTLLIAGHETTAIAIAWCGSYLAREPRALAALRAEIDAAPDRPEVLVKLPYLSAFCDEVLRLRPPVTDVVRVVREDTPVGTWTVPKGRAVAVSINAITRDPAVYPEPDAFRPERFLERRFSGAELPVFGGGHRHCLGRVFAEYELRLVVARLARRWDLSALDNRSERLVRRNVTMAPASGIPVRVRARARERAGRPT